MYMVLIIKKDEWEIRKMPYKQIMEQWLNFSELETVWKKDLELLAEDEKRAEDAFYRDLEFGTGGMRGEIGAGTNRINTYTVRKATNRTSFIYKSSWNRCDGPRSSNCLR